MSEYTEQADKFLTDHNLTFRAVFVGEDCPTFCEDAAKGNVLEVGTFPRKNHIHGSHWRLTIAAEKRGHFALDFWDSYDDAEARWTKQNHIEASRIYVPQMFGGKSQTLDLKHRSKKLRELKPSAYDMLACITKSEPGTFEDFCGDFGYDNDSRRAEGVYQAVVKEWRQVSKFFTAEELAEIQEIN